MTIAAHISFTGSGNDINSNINYNCLSLLARTYTQHHFIFIFDAAFDISIIREKNITPVLLSPQIKNTILRYYWYNFKLPGLLKKYQADFYINSDNLCSFRTNVPQCLVIKELSFLQKNNLYQKTDSRYFKKSIKRILSAATSIAVINDHLKIKLISLFPETEKKISIITPGINNNKGRLDDDKILQTKDHLTNGKEYFLYYNTAASADIIPILKAFSIFKKWQKSNMQLIILNAAEKKESTIKDLSTYKYREEIKIINVETDDSFSDIIQAAYAALYFPYVESMERECLLTIQHNIPLICIENNFFESSFADAAIYSNVNEKNIAEQMMMLYKDESKRNSMISKQKMLAATWNWEKTAALLWRSIQP